MSDMRLALSAENGVVAQSVVRSQVKDYKFSANQMPMQPGISLAKFPFTACGLQLALPPKQSWRFRGLSQFVFRLPGRFRLGFDFLAESCYSLTGYSWLLQKPSL